MVTKKVWKLIFLHSSLLLLFLNPGSGNSADNFYGAGLVKLNYSGSWSVRDVWEAGGWEPRPDQLTWQQYELAAALRQVPSFFIEYTVKGTICRSTLYMYVPDLNPYEGSVSYHFS